LQLEQRIFICDINKLFITLSSPVCHNCQGRITLLTILTHNTRIIVGVGGEEVLWIVVAVNDDFTQSIVNMNILASLTHEMLQELSEQTKSIPKYHKENISNKKIKK
jgi:hypothetical protein